MSHKYVKEEDTFSTLQNGTVPKPTAQEVSDGKVLSADGTWVPQSGGGGGTSNRNLLLNPWFTVNQRGFSSGSAAKWTVDEWKKADSTGTLTLTSNGLQFPANTECKIQQIFEERPWSGKVITISLMYSDGSVVAGTDTWTIGGSEKTFIDDGKMNVRINSNGNLVIRHSTSDANARIVRALKLEIGDESTLALDVSPDYTNELLKCQRYFVRLGDTSQQYCGFDMVIVRANSSLAYINLPVPLRTNSPTITYAGKLQVYNGNYYTVMGITLSDSTPTLLRLVCTTEVTTANPPVGQLVGGQVGTYIDIDAELE